MRTPAAFSLLALLATTALPLAAQTSEEPVKRGQPTVNVDFKGGSLADYLEVLRANGEHNIVIPQKAKAIQVRAVNLRGVTIGNAIDVVAKTLENDRFTVSLSSLVGQGNPVYAVNVREVPVKNQRELDEHVVTTRAFSLRDIIEPPPATTGGAAAVMSAETVLSAINIGVKIAIKGDEKDPPLLQFHPESGLLFVQGSPWVAEFVRSILHEIESDLKGRRSAAKAAASRPQEPKDEKTDKK